MPFQLPRPRWPFLKFSQSTDLDRRNVVLRSLDLTLDQNQLCRTIRDVPNLNGIIFFSSWRIFLCKRSPPTFREWNFGWSYIVHLNILSTSPSISSLFILIHRETTLYWWNTQIKVNWHTFDFKTTRSFLLWTFHSRHVCKSFVSREVFRDLQKFWPFWGSKIILKYNLHFDKPSGSIFKLKTTKETLAAKTEWGRKFLS